MPFLDATGVQVTSLFIKEKQKIRLCGAGKEYVSLLAIYHNEVKVITRGEGRSACAAAAYISCAALYNDYDGIHHDYTRKGGLVWERVFLPPMAPSVWQDKEQLWNAVEAAEQSKDSRLAREHIVALPIELNKEQWAAIVTDYTQTQFVAEGMCVHAAIHDTDGHNPHAHILTTVRPLNPDGTWQNKTEKEYLCIRNGEKRGFTAAEFKTARNEGWEKQYPYRVGKKKVYMSMAEGDAHGYERTSKNPKSTRYGRQNPIAARWNSEDQLEKWRAAWGDTVNRYLKQAGREERVDHRSNEARRIDEKPTVHEGVAARVMEQQGMLSDRCEINREIKMDNRLIRRLKTLISDISTSALEAIGEIAYQIERLRGKIIEGFYSLSGNRKTISKLRSARDGLIQQCDAWSSIRADRKKEIQKLHRLKNEKKALSPIHVLKHREYDRAIADQEAVIHNLQNVEGRMLKQIGVKDGSDIKLRADQLQNQIARVNQAMQATEERIHVCEVDYQELAERSKQYDSEEVQRKRIVARAEIENNIAAVAQEKTGAAVSPLMMAQSIAEADKLLSVTQHEIREISPEQREDILEDHV